MRSCRSLVWMIVAAGTSSFASVAEAYVTAGDPGDYIVVPGTSAYGVDLDGVSDVLLDLDGTDEFYEARGSGALLWTGRHILTAAHVVTEANSRTIGIAATSDVFFDLPGESLAYSFDAADVAIHPSYSGSTSDGYDVAIITLPTAVDAAVPRYNLFTSYGLEGGTSVKSGYGSSGTGATGVSLGSGIKRAGLNRYEDDGTALDAIVAGSFTNLETMLVYDFDNGLPANDAFGYWFGPDGEELGFGADEVGSAPGDSGGPSFLFEDGQWRIAGVTSFGVTFTGSDELGNIYSSDVDDLLNSSFGEFAADARIAHPGILSWINGVVPEPTTLSLLAVGALATLRRRAV